MRITSPRSVIVERVNVEKPFEGQRMEVPHCLSKRKIAFIPQQLTWVLGCCAGPGGHSRHSALNVTVTGNESKILYRGHHNHGQAQVKLWRIVSGGPRRGRRESQRKCLGTFVLAER